MNYPLAKPSIGKEEERAVLAVLRSGVLSMGPKVEEFEKKFAKFAGTKYAIAVSSGTAGLHLALIGAGITEGDEVITTPFSFVASANAILYVGAKPVFVDIEPVTYNIDPDKIESAITPKTKAILVVHILGQSSAMEKIMTIAKKHNLKIIEDSCESIGATHSGKRVGTFGESAVFAFYPNKQMTTGEGGMMVTNDLKLSKLFKSLRNQGRGEDKVWLDHERLGYNYRMDEMSAAVGLVQLQKIEKLIAERENIAKWYHAHLAGYDDLVEAPRTGKGNTHTWFVYVVLVPEGKRDKVIARLHKKGVSVKPYFPSIHLFSFHRARFGFKEGDFPISEGVSARSLALPFYSGLSEKDVKSICESLADALH
ncbi:MAG: DegT/DnrJ/EryC1/StrS family aminotransferase [bacterium]|nr:DegT/DnrJ/EryC1/StrS family aminotransferase [bacterium]